MKLLIFGLALCLPVFCQIEAGCTPNSLTVQISQALSVAGMWEYNCYARNLGSAPATLSLVGFALDFPQLQQVNQGDVADVLTQKQAQSGWAKVGKYAGLAGVAALIAVGGPGAVLGSTALRYIGIATYGATQLEKYSVSQVPSAANAISGMLTQDQVLQPGQGVSWKVYASNVTSVSPGPLSGRRSRLGVTRPTPSLGPKILTNTTPQVVTKAAVLPQQTDEELPVWYAGWMLARAYSN